VDKDGRGDLSDPLPLPDLDHDRILDNADNYVNLANPLQRDSDLDKKDDVCDPSPV
jgi:hypothetical protein